MEFPTTTEITQALMEVQADMRKADASLESVDVRLQVRDDGDWTVHWGDASFDLDHRGYWGASELMASDDNGAVRMTALDLIGQVEDMWSQDESVGF